MKKILLLLGVFTLVAPQLFGYWVVMKDGTRYETTAKPTVSGGKASFTLKSNGQVVQVPAESIDNAKSEEVTRLGVGTVLGVEQRITPATPQQSSLGSAIKLRRQQQPPTPEQPVPVAAPPVPSGPTLGANVLDKFERAYENVGI